MNERYGIDLESGIIKRRSGRWLRVRILGLLSVPYSYVVTEAGSVPVPVTRLQSALDAGRG
jgi:hypothetical protein